MAARVLTLRELNRALLTRQLLLDRKRLSPVAVVERLVGMQAQWPPAPYVGIWTRVTSFQRETLERAILAGEVLKPTVMRGTLHLVTARDYPMFFAAFKDLLTWFRGIHLEAALEVVPAARALAEREPLTMMSGLALLEEHGHVDQEARRIFHAVRRHAHLLHGPETALWSSRPLAVYHPVPEPEPVDVLAARTELMRRYLTAFGPATRADIADWSGLRVTDFAPALEALEPLRRFCDERGRELLDVQRAPLPDADTPAPVRFLPTWDATLLVNCRRTQILPERHRPVIFSTTTPHSVGTLLVDGQVAGTWRTSGDSVEVETFEALPRAARRELKDETERLREFVR